MSQECVDALAASNSLLNDRESVDKDPNDSTYDEANAKRSKKVETRLKIFELMTLFFSICMPEDKISDLNTVK